MIISDQYRSILHSTMHLQLFNPFGSESPLPVQQEYNQLLIWCAESRFRAALTVINRDPPTIQKWKQIWLQRECVSCAVYFHYMY